jgi:hypothetical protein
MNEATMACVDPNVIDATADDASPGTEEHNVTGCYGLQRYLMCRLSLLIGGARNVQSHAFVHINHESAAVEAPCVGAAKMIGSSDELRGSARDRSSATIAEIGCPRNAAAARKRAES